MLIIKKLPRPTLLNIQLNNQQFCLVKDVNASKPIGKLSIVATPIGNLSDLTPNTLKCLFKADLIGCEDRRVAGQLYTLIRNKNILERIQAKFGTIGLTNLILRQQKQQQQLNQTQKSHQFYEYSNMNDKQRRKFLSRLSLEEQKQFKLDYLKYRAKKIVNKNEQFLYKTKNDKFDELYGIEVSDYKHIQSQIINTRAKKGRGVLIPLNTYSETKMFDLVKNMLETKHVAIVSDAGMPCISDPGWKLVRMVREVLPTVPVEVIGGPSALDIMLTLARGATQSNRSVTGRFEGFASPQVSSITEQNMVYNKFLQEAKQKDFSIHFINSKKMKKVAYVLQRIYGEDHRIILANELTKKFEKKFSGTLKQLVEHISKDQKQFEGIGEMSYILYSDKKKGSKAEQVQNSQQKLPNESKSEFQLSSSLKQIQDLLFQNDEKIERVLQLNVNTFAKSLNQTTLKAKQKADLLAAVFGIKGNAAKNFVYQNTVQRKQRKSIAEKKLEQTY